MKAEFAGADACIWYEPVALLRGHADRTVRIRTVGVTPMKSMAYDFAEVKRVCHDCTLAGLKAMYEAGASRPFRFCYLSASGVSRDLTQKPLIMGDFLLMRVSTSILALVITVAGHRC